MHEGRHGGRQKKKVIPVFLAKQAKTERPTNPTPALDLSLKTQAQRQQFNPPKGKRKKKKMKNKLSLSSPPSTF